MAQRSATAVAKRAGVALLTAVVALGFGAAAKPSAAPQFTRLLPLDPDEGVFAYARISPDGKTFVYASEARSPMAPERFTLTEAVNQNPTTLLFQNGTLIDRRLGAQSAEELEALVRGQTSSATSAHSPDHR